jgi:endo-1,4-beta-xylanase
MVNYMNIENTIKSGLYMLMLMVALPTGAFAQTAGQTPDMDPIAEGKEKWLGNIYSSPQIENFTSYWNQVTPENAGKWESVEGTRDEMNWGTLDAAYNLAKENGLPFRYHILVWGGQQPDWINDLETEEQLEEITEWFELVAKRYPDIDYLEVVNEGSNDHQLPDGDSGDANYIEALGGTGDTGHDWIITAFEMANDIFPEKTKLMINDYGIVGNTSATKNYITIIQDLQDRDLIDVIGVQAHAFSTSSPSSSITETLNMLGDTGLPIQATEMDIDGDSDADDDVSDQVQLEEIQRVFPIFWEHPAVEGVTLWGWRPGLWRQAQDAFLIRNNGQERPALEWLREYVENTELDSN